MADISNGITVTVAPPAGPQGVVVVPVPGPRGLTGAASTVPGPASTVPGPPGPASVAYDTDGVPYLLI